MMKKMFTLLLALCLLLTAVPAVFATEVPEATEVTEAVRAENECGEGITWAFEDGVLTIRGDGEMDDFEKNGAPWQEYRDKIEEVIIEGELTYIGAYAFSNYDSLLAVSFGEALYEIGREAFSSCDGLTALWLPKTFKIFGEGSLQSCKNLKEIHCSGVFPSFRQNCLWDSYLTIYYPAERPWSVEYIQQLEEAFKGRVQFLASDGTDHYEPTEAATEPEETIPATTVPPTQPPVETEPPVTEAPATEPEQTEAETLPEAPETEPETEPEIPETEAEENPPQKKDGIPTGLIIVGAVLAGLGLGALVFGRKKGKYSR